MHGCLYAGAGARLGTCVRVHGRASAVCEWSQNLRRAPRVCVRALSRSFSAYNRMGLRWSCQAPTGAVAAHALLAASCSTCPSRAMRILARSEAGAASCVHAGTSVCLCRRVFSSTPPPPSHACALSRSASLSRAVSLSLSLARERALSFALRWHSVHEGIWRAASEEGRVDEVPQARRVAQRGLQAPPGSSLRAGATVCQAGTRRRTARR